MPTVDTIPSGAPCWVDLFTSDPEKSVAFYSGLLGWTHEDAGEEFGHYINFSKDGARVAGAMGNDGSAGQPDGWTVYLLVPDVEKALATAEAEGGQVVMPPMEIGEIGVMGMVLDPSGAAIGIWQAKEHPGFGVLAEPGAPGWFELHTRDYGKAVPFYRNVFGWDATTVGDSDEFRYTTLGKDEDSRAGIMDASGFLPEGTPSFWTVYFAVADVDDAVAKAVQLGAKVADEATDTPYGRLVGLTDPTGAYVKLMGPNNEPVAG
jgi:predicted enzyme related to lactoylglutathione lyase